LNNILLLGDSLTWGWRIENHHRFSNLLEKNFKRAFINAGMPGKEPEYYLHLHDYLSEKYQPKKVFIFIFANDVVGTRVDTSYREVRSTLTRQMNSFPTYLTLIKNFWPRLFVLGQKVFGYHFNRNPFHKSPIIQNTRLDQIIELAKNEKLPEEKINKWLERLTPKTKELIKEGMLSNAIVNVGLKNSGFWKMPLDLDTEEALRKYSKMNNDLNILITNIKASGAQPYLFYLPYPAQYDANFVKKEFTNSGVIFNPAWHKEDSKLQTELKKFSLETGITFIDLTPDFRSFSGDKSELYFGGGDPHITIKGNQLVANALARYINHKIISL
jgi:lysophospholipase L1-like esterase